MFTFRIPYLRTPTTPCGWTGRYVMVHWTDLRPVCCWNYVAKSIHKLFEISTIFKHVTNFDTFFCTCETDFNINGKKVWNKTYFWTKKAWTWTKFAKQKHISHIANSDLKKYTIMIGLGRSKKYCYMKVNNCVREILWFVRQEFPNRSKAFPSWWSLLKIPDFFVMC